MERNSLSGKYHLYVRTYLPINMQSDQSSKSQFFSGHSDLGVCPAVLVEIRRLNAILCSNWFNHRLAGMTAIAMAAPVATTSFCTYRSVSHTDISISFRKHSFSTGGAALSQLYNVSRLNRLLHRRGHWCCKFSTFIKKVVSPSSSRVSTTQSTYAVV